MANYTIGDNIYAAGPFPVAYVGTALATLKPIPVVDFVNVYEAASYSVDYFATEEASLKPITITDTVWSALSYSVNFLSTTGAVLSPRSSQGLFQAYVSGYSPQFISTISASLKPLNIPETLVFNAFSFPTGGGGGGGNTTPTSGQIWPSGLC